MLTITFHPVPNIWVRMQSAAAINISSEIMFKETDKISVSQKLTDKNVRQACSSLQQLEQK